MPFSKRADDSLRRLKALDALRIAIGSNKAASKATVVVVSIISESLPPITPAKATGSFPLVITICSGVSSRVSSSKVTKVSPALARRTTIS